MSEMKRCSRCGKEKPLSEFYERKDGKRAGKPHCRCKKCNSEYKTEWAHRTGKCISMTEKTDCSAYLGIVIAERVLYNFFDHVVRMPTNNPGYDFICGKGHKIDVKSACRGRKTTSFGWQFNVRDNEIADYFLCLAFDNRESLEPQHIWLISRSVVNKKAAIWVTDTYKGVSKWSSCERPLDKVLACCDTLRSEA